MNVFCNKLAPIYILLLMYVGTLVVLLSIMFKAREPPSKLMGGIDKFNITVKLLERLASEKFQPLNEKIDRVIEKSSECNGHVLNVFDKINFIENLNKQRFEILETKLDLTFNNNHSDSIDQIDSFYIPSTFEYNLNKFEEEIVHRLDLTNEKLDAIHNNSNCGDDKSSDVSSIKETIKQIEKNINKNDKSCQNKYALREIQNQVNLLSTNLGIYNNSSNFQNSQLLDLQEKILCIQNSLQYYFGIIFPRSNSPNRIIRSAPEYTIYPESDNESHV